MYLPKPPALSEFVHLKNKCSDKNRFRSLQHFRYFLSSLILLSQLHHFFLLAGTFIQRCFFSLFSFYVFLRFKLSSKIHRNFSCYPMPGIVHEVVQQASPIQWVVKTPESTFQLYILDIA